MFQILPFIIIILASLLFFNNSKSYVNKTVSIVIPAFNEEKSIGHVLETVKKVSEITQIIVVDDGSTDNTSKIVSKFNDVILLKHEKNKGKGSAMKTGLKKVTNEIVLFLDADLSEINQYQVEAIIKPILEGNADITKTKFKREAGRVTELTAKPLLQFFFPELNFDQPLSGQFAAIKSFLDKIDLEHDYGVDIGIVLDADAQGMRIEEVDIGNMVHEMSTLQELNIMANEVVRTIVDRAISYGRLTLVDDLGNAIRMEIMGLSLITFGIFGLFFIKYMGTLVSALVILLGLFISLFYIFKIIRMSFRMYKQTKIPTLQIFKSFMRMHFPVVISVIILFAIVVSLLGSVNISSNEISIEPASKNLVISTVSQPRSSVDVRGPYTVESALENEQHLIRLSNSALNTLQAHYGDFMYIDGKSYQLEQPVGNENDLIRISEDPRKVLDIATETVVRDSDLRGLFENTYLVRNIHNDEVANIEADGNQTKLDIINNTTVNVVSQITTQARSAKILSVYVNNTKVAQVTGSFVNGTYLFSVNNETVDSFDLNSSSHGLLYNGTCDGQYVEVVVESSDANSTNLFADSSSKFRFLNINI
ncbi:glycosyltransferase [Methanosphaera sp. ISO3-F5]|uniref:glycosyltransferase n=1 Tax=Methanosphaera sp. ISO3-F5 TaxID=1452353 RepID=UPI002B25A128|nr:glycosyltransferase [Methanosphaera sp. ISO3-F5]WQH64832.1 glycosyltransferase [Methanosphaera sp. ISO3-F5]